MKINFYRKKEFKNNILLTTEHGSFTFLTKKEYIDFEKGDFSNNNLVENDIIIKDENSIIEKLRNKKCFLFQGPSLHIIVLTLRCDQSCIYCHASSKGCDKKQFDLTKEIADKIIETILQVNSKKLNIEFQGGEPLLNFEILKYIVDEINKKKKDKEILFSLVSNFAVMDENKLNYLIEKNIGICTSLDGPKHLHNKNRAKYEVVTEWIEKIQKKNKEVSALVTITKDSLSFPKEIVNEYLKNNFKEIHLRPLKKLGDARKNIDIYYTVDDFINFWKESMDYILEINKNIKFIERETKFMLQKIFSKYDPGYLELRSPCGAVIGQLLYDYDGSIYSCDEGRMLNEDLFKVGNVNKTLKEITTSEESIALISSSINDSYYCDSCAYKPYCGLCPVLNYAEFGTIIGRISESDWCKLHKAQFDYIFDKLQYGQYKKIFLSWLNE